MQLPERPPPDPHAPENRSQYPAWMTLFGLLLIVLGSAAPGAFDSQVDEAVWEQLRLDEDKAPGYAAWAHGSFSSRSPPPPPPPLSLLSSVSHQPSASWGEWAFPSLSRWTSSLTSSSNSEEDQLPTNHHRHLKPSANTNINQQQQHQHPPLQGKDKDLFSQDRVLLKFYMFDVQNPTEFINRGDPLRVVERGPFVYELVLDHVNVSWWLDPGTLGGLKKSDEVRFKTWQHARLVASDDHDRDKDGGALNDSMVVTTVNVPFQVALHTAASLPVAGAVLLDAIYHGVSARDAVFTTRTVREHLFGYGDAFPDRAKADELLGPIEWRPLMRGGGVYRFERYDECESVDPDSLTRKPTQSPSSTSPSPPSSTSRSRSLSRSLSRSTSSSSSTKTSLPSTLSRYPGFVQNISTWDELNTRVGFDG